MMELFIIGSGNRILNDYLPMLKYLQSKNESSISISFLKDRMHRSMIVVFNKESEVIEKNLTFLPLPCPSAMGKMTVWSMRSFHIFFEHAIL